MPDKPLQRAPLEVSQIELDDTHGVRDFAFSAGVDKLLRTSYRLRELRDRVEIPDTPSDVAVEIARNADGSVVVFPADAA